MPQQTGPLPVAPPPGPADVGLVGALPIELQAFKARLRDVRTYQTPRSEIVEGLCGDRLVAMVAAGTGAISARRGAELLLAGHRPRWLISAGFGGALDPELNRNDVVFAQSVLSLAEGPDASLEIDLALPERHEPQGRICLGRFLTVDHIIRTAAEKAELRERHHCDVVDMETYPVAALAADRGVRFLGLRVVSDDAIADLPPEILTIVGPTGSFRLGATLGALWKRPGSVKDLWKLREHAIEAADRLALILPSVIQSLG
jgi:adenosylhomocysteine nucleosidase